MTSPVKFDWNDLKYFLAVARNGSTLAAARALGTSQSTVHRRLKELEAQLGRLLVKRHPTGYRLTELGSGMLRHAERVEDALIAFERHLAASDRAPAGVVRVTCPEGVGYRLMRSAVLKKFNAAFPNLRVEFVITNKILDLAKGEADVAIRGSPPGGDGLFGRKIAELPWAVYAKRSYAKRYGPLVSAADLNRHPVIALDGQLSNHHPNVWLKSVAPHAKISARADSLQTLLLAAKSGVGLATLPVIFGEGERGLARVFEPSPAVVTPFYLMIHEDMRRTPRVRSLFDFFVQELKLIRSILGHTRRTR
jgi:DNA-binding transcriptional LysR family regulator